MLFSYNLLSEIINLKNIDVSTLTERLTFSGFEVEDVSKMASGDKLVIGQIIECKKHPDSDHLHLLKVDCGEEGILPIVCGAPNARVGLKVIVALVGCNLPALNIVIKESEIRGYDSKGMCCSLVELGVNKEFLTEKQLNGIEELPEDAPIGERDVLSYLKLDDTILDINVLPNRPDCLSYLGMAREIAGLFNLEAPDVPKVLSNDLPSIVAVGSNTAHCVRFDILSIRDAVSVKNTPLKIRNFLEASGVRSISPLVDLGNFTMLLSGQPINVYDADKNPFGKYIVRDDYEGEFIAFDNKKYELKKGDLVVSDGERNLCLAGIMASIDAPVKENTTKVDIEFAIFDHVSIRHTSSRLGLTSFSQQLFSKERNPLLVNESIDILLSLLPYFLESYTITSYSSYDGFKQERVRIPFSLEKLNKRLGSSYTEDEVKKVFSSYRFDYDGHSVLPPIDRVDILEQCDLDEEIFRYYDASKVKPSIANFPISIPSDDSRRENLNIIRSMLVCRGLSESISYTLLSKEEDRSFRVFDNDESYRVLNPMTNIHEYVRSDILSSMYSLIEYNKRNQNNDLALFEISDVDTKKGVKTYLSIGLSDDLKMMDQAKAHSYSFFDIKGHILSILEKLNINPSRYRLVPSTNNSFHPYQSADLYIGKDLVATFGKIHPSISSDNIYLAEINLGYLLDLKGMKTKFVAYSTFPIVKRDLSFKLYNGVTYEAIKKSIMKIKDESIIDVHLFDYFRDKKTNSDYIGITIYLGSDKKTLKDEEINASIEKVILAVKGDLGLVLKGQDDE